HNENERAGRSMNPKGTIVLDDAGSTSYLDAEALRALRLDDAPVIDTTVVGGPSPDIRQPARPGDPVGQKPGDPVGKSDPRPPSKPGPQKPGDPVSCQGICR